MERVREDESGDSEDGEDDELPCVMVKVKETVSDLTRLAKISGTRVRSIDKERLVIFR